MYKYFISYNIVTNAKYPKVVACGYSFVSDKDKINSTEKLNDVKEKIINEMKDDFCFDSRKHWLQIINLSYLGEVDE